MKRDISNRVNRTTNEDKKTGNRTLPKGISKRKDGRYLVRITKNKVTKSGYRNTVEEAIELRKEFEELISSGEFERQNNEHISERTLRELFYESMDKDKSIKISTRQVYYQYWRLYLETSMLADMKIGEIRSSDVRSTYGTIAEERDLSKSTYDTISSLIKRVYTYASYTSDEDFVAPLRGVLKEVRPKKKKEKKVITREVERRLVEYMTEHNMTKYVYMFQFLIQTGMRIGEACALTWDDIDHGWIAINKTLKYSKIEQNKGYTMYISTTKTEKSTRKIPLTDKVIEILEHEKERQDNMKLSCKRKVPMLDYRGKKIGEVSGFIFLNGKGNPYREENIRVGLRRAVDGLNREEDRQSKRENRLPNRVDYINPHLTRHTTITRLLSNKINPATVAELVGHERVETTLNEYAYVSDEEKIEAAKAI